jgi:hypothetical protein
MACSPTDSWPCFRGICCLHIQGLPVWRQMWQVPLKLPTQCHISEDSVLHNLLITSVHLRNIIGMTPYRFEEHHTTLYHILKGSELYTMPMYEKHNYIIKISNTYTHIFTNFSLLWVWNGSTHSTLNKILLSVTVSLKYSAKLAKIHKISIS